MITTFVLTAPYLWLGSRIRVGPWEAIPRLALEESDVVSPAALGQVLGLLDLYHPVPRGRREWGCVFRQVRRRVGQPFPRSHIEQLRRAVVAALLDRNPALDRDRHDSNLGHTVATSDNAALYGHRIDPEGYVAVDYGAIVTALTGGIRIGEPTHAIHPPSELALPLLGPQPDESYADALFKCLTHNTEAARRLGTAIDWLDLAWRNTTSTSFETRVVLLKFGFEVLLDAGDKWMHQRQALSALLPDTGRRRRRRVWTHQGKQHAQTMSDLEWWFSNFTWLRNAIAHGERVSASDHRWGRTYHIWVAEARLRRAIKHTVAERGFEHVLLNPYQRARWHVRHDQERAS